MQNKNERAVFLTLYAVVSNKCGSAKRAAWFGKLEQKSHSIDKCLRFLPLGLLCYVMLCSLVSKEAFEPQKTKRAPKTVVGTVVASVPRPRSMILSVFKESDVCK